MGNQSSITKALAGVILMAWPTLAHAQLFFESDAVFLGRNNDGGSTVVSGAQPVSTNSGSFGAEPGYRLGLGAIMGNWQVDGSFTQLSPWSSSAAGVFGSDLFLDSGGPNNLEFNGFLKNAASSAFNGEGTENELLAAGTTFSTFTTSNYLDGEINIGSSPACRRWRLAGGYRHVSLDEKNGVLFNGTFNAQDTVPGSGGPFNNGLSDAALVGAGAELVSGAGDGFDTGDFLTYAVNTSVQNRLDGFQAVFGYRLIERERLTVEATGKAGIYCNQIKGAIQESVAGSGTDNSVYQRWLNGRERNAAFVGNLGLRGVLGLTDYIDFILGGEILFLNGIALGQDQLNGVQTNALGQTTYQVQNKGSLIGYGGTIGLRIFW